MKCCCVALFILMRGRAARVIVSNECNGKGRIIERVRLEMSWGKNMGKRLHNTLDVSRVDTRVLSLKSSECLWVFCSFFLDSEW